MKLHVREKSLYKLENQILYLLDDWWLDDQAGDLRDLRDQCKELRNLIINGYQRLNSQMKIQDLQSFEQNIIFNSINLNDEISINDDRIARLYVDLNEGKIEKTKSFYNIIKNRTLKSQKIRKHIIDLFNHFKFEET